MPITLSSLTFGPRGGKVFVILAFLAMFPRALFVSSDTMTALWETLTITLIASLTPLGLELYKKQEKQLEATRERLETTQKELHTTVQLSKEREKQLDVINAFSVLLSRSLELNQVMNTTIDMVMRLMQVEVALIYSINDDIEELELVAHRGIGKDYIGALSNLKLGEGLCGRVVETKKPIAVQDPKEVLKLHSAPLGEERVHAELGVPLMAHSKVMGALYVAMKSDRQLKEPDIKLLVALGNLIGVAMRNARLYQEREVATERLKSSEKKYRQLFENAHDAIWVQDLSGVVITANKAAAALFGYDLSALIGIDSRELFSRQDHTLSRTLQEDVLSAQGKEQPYTQEIIRKDGTKAYVMLTSNLISSNGKPDGVQFIGRDITNEIRMQENRQFYLQQITRAHEDERQRISRDLHDSTAQSLIAILRSLEKFCEEDGQLSAERLALLWDLHAQLKESLGEIRQLSRDLRPLVIDDLGLLPAVEWLTQQLKNEHDIEANLTILGEKRRFLPEVEVTIFRIVQEALRNIAKHSNATKAQVTIAFKKEETRVIVIDNGEGFELPQTLGELSRIGKLGLDGIQTRAKLVGGTLNIRSDPEDGTTLIVTIPV